ncbi:ABC transporter permease [Nocardioides sp. IC4_145]|uniref:ABC transporter permease n=1 Tax=Nocardioides sp. IC4_145 TaxID=2714037 RepID=UPI00140E1A84|nr:ABC transporter permease [Nocardioides sp. IC4_145]NHC23322.1 ABC transporter permease [Nocardioides sp. IC4_145]
MTTTTTGPAAASPSPEAPVRDRADVRRQVRLVITFGLVLAALVVFALLIEDPKFTYLLGEKRTAEFTPKDANATVISWGAVVVAAIALVLAVLDRFPRGWKGALLGILVGLAFYAGFLMWAYTDQGEGGFQAFIANPIPGTIRIATPLVLGALAGCLCERAGVINIAIEAQFLSGAFFASVFSSIAYSSLVFIPVALCAVFGLLGGVLAGVLIAAMLGWFALRYRVNQVVLGVVLVAFATGLTSFLLGQIPSDHKETLNDPQVLEKIEIPVLADIPVVGDALFNQTLLVYLMYASVALVTFLLFQTRWGLRVRAVGEHPKAADTVGIQVNRVRWQAVLLGGVFAGLGGAYYTVGSTGAFDREVSAGTGFIALAAVIMGRWHPVGATFAAVFFGFMWNLQNQLSFVQPVPGELLGAAPYLATIIAVAGFVGRVRPPAADGEPYVKG